MKFVFDKRFTTKVERTPRVLEMAEAFGLGISDKEFVIYDHLEIEVLPGDVIYITGQSGSGKSLLLRFLAEELAKTGLQVANLDTLEFPDKPVIDCLGHSTTHSADLLSKAGISDAYLYLRKPRELSDGQRYRLKLAMLQDSGAKVWVADEFGAILDRETALGVAFNLSKVAKREGVILIVATTHTDLKADLAPTLTIEKRFREKIEIAIDRPSDFAPAGAQEHVFQ